MIIDAATPQSRGRSTSLVVMLHAPTACPQDMAGVKDAVMEAQPDADLMVPALPLHLTSTADPVAIADAVLEAIDQADRARRRQNAEGYAEIVLIGHCIGALLARKVYLVAAGTTERAGFKPSAVRPWAGRVTRIILLAGLNRGWSTGPHLPRPLSTLVRGGAALARLLGRGRPWLACRRGADFITELRIQWLAMLRRSERPPLTVQLLGTRDEAVTQDDDIDLQTGGNFIYLEVPRSTHHDIIDFDGPAGTDRRAVFLEALTTPEAQLKHDNELQIAPEHEPDPTVKHVVFVVHGIRDHGFWTTRVARRIQRVARRQGKRFITITASYGYFPMWPFIFSYFGRQKNVHWLMDQYTMALARYPNAAFSFVGHSNGTYLLASALRNYPSCRFDRVMFAGSVVRTGFPWNRMIADGRVNEVRNFVASNDWVVAVFPGVYEQLGLSDLGRAGSDGFQPHLPVDQHRWVGGGHNAAIREESWQSIAEFIVNGSSAPVPELKPAPSPVMRLLSATALLCWLLLIATIAGLFWLLLTAWPESWKTVWYWWLLPTLGYFYGLYYVLNKV